MRVFAVVLALSLVLAAAPSFAQAPAAPAGQKPAAPAPAAAAPAPPVLPKFADGMKYAIVRIDVVAGLSNEGKALQARAQAAQEQKAKELNDRNRQLQAIQEKLEKTGSVMSDQAREQSQRDIERLQRDIQRFTEDAQAELQSLTQQLQLEFEKKLVPVIDQVAKAKGVHFVYNFNDGGFIWVDPGIDLTGEVITAFDAATKGK